MIGAGVRGAGSDRATCVLSLGPVQRLNVEENVSEECVAVRCAAISPPRERTGCVPWAGHGLQHPRGRACLGPAVSSSYRLNC